MRTLERFLATVCAILFILGGVLSLFLFNIERKAFSSATYKQALEDQRLYERMPALLATALTTSIAQNGIILPPFLQALTVDDWQIIISSILPPEELRALTDQSLDSTFDYLNNKTNSVVISLLPLKAQLAGESGVDVIRQFLRTQPECTIEQLTQMALGLLGGEVALCNPPEEAIGLMAPFIQTQLQAMISTFPNELTLVPGTDSGTPNDPRLRLQMVRSAIVFSPFFVALLLLAVALFAVRSLTDWLVWWGWPLMITGAIAVLIALIGSPVVGWFLQFLIQNQGAILLPPILASSIGETASAVASQMLIPVTLQGLILAIVGLGMVIFGVLLTKREVRQVI